ncbi:hypothetical protein EVAR_56102_1 [Eumeta japonica]|uniref:Uncharacterized protein n=1 Tax=Eumeta variegata TaxID=151549 RepID=A0A4C1YG28_EUMVA|nr:hypothetical protein EVAR_56102_1 [Eumeta japonica]
MSPSTGTRYTGSSHGQWGIIVTTFYVHRSSQSTPDLHISWSILLPVIRTGEARSRGKKTDITALVAYHFVGGSDVFNTSVGVFRRPRRRPKLGCPGCSSLNGVDQSKANVHLLPLDTAKSMGEIFVTHREVTLSVQFHFCAWICVPSICIV